MPATATTNNLRYRYGESNPVKAPYKSGVAVNVGDLVFVDTSDGNTVKPAMSFTWNTNLATTQPLFVAKFLGVAAQQFDGTNTAAYGVNDGTLRVDTDGVFDFACAAATFNVGDLVGVAQDGANSNLAGQTVVAVASATLAIGKVVQQYASNTTTVRVKIKSSYLSIPANN